ncbi:MAG: SRPBCC family protein [Gemmatales bacterium]
MMATLMPEYQLRRQQFIPKSIESVFAFFADAANLEYLTPPWLHFKIRSTLPIDMKTGASIDYTIRWRLLPITWRTEILDWSPPYRFVDQQIKGPYRLWHHTHSFEVNSGGTLMTDFVRYALPYGPLGKLARRLMVKRDLNAIFDYRFSRIAECFGSVKYGVPLDPLRREPDHAPGQNF